MKLPPAVADVLRVAAPTLAAALAGPFAPLAAGLVTAALKQWLPPGVEKAKPADVVAAVEGNRDKQDFVLQLRQAELELLKAERELPFRFAELEQKDRQSAREMGRDTGLSRPLFFFGMGFVVLTVLCLFGIVGLGFWMLKGGLVVTSANLTMVPVFFNLVGAVVTAMVAFTGTVMGFYYGSSAGSKEKTAELGAAVQDMGAALAERPAPAPPAPPVVVVPSPAPQEPVEADWRQGPYGGQRWRLTPAGVVLEGQAEPLRTVGQPATVRRIWAEFGPLVAAACATHGGPLEIVVATIATESRGKPAAVLVEPDGRQSVGLMQTLVGTASETLGRPVTGLELNDPALSIEAGVRYIAKQRPETQYDPPLVAAAYNAGGLHPPREGDTNPWRLRSTGDHITRFCQFYGDACAVAASDGWAQPVAAAA